MDLTSIILLVPVLLISLSFHEYMHGRVSYMLGDPTPKAMGRLTMNPLAHLDLMGSLVLIITRRIGWAKPVPINPRYYDNPRQGMMYVGIAGPGANLLLAILFSLFIRILASVYGIGNMQLNYLLKYIQYNGPENIPQAFFFMLLLGVIINLSLAIFNLIPIPPLDGSKILRGFLPPRFDKYFYKLEGPAGMVVIMILAFTGILGSFIFPIVTFLRNILI